jgi:lysophospholipase L1-like esterase
MKPAPALAAIVALAVAAGGVTHAGKNRKKPRKASEPVTAAVLEDAKGLHPFYAALGTIEDGTATRPARITVIGDSLIAGDKIADRIRRRLAARFGDGGPGFVHPVPIEGSRTRAAKRVAKASAWRIHKASSPVPADKLLGFGGVSAESKSTATIRIEPTAKTVTSVDVYTLSQPRGGDLEVVIDGKPAQTITTAAGAKAAAFTAVTSATPIQKVELRADGKVRLFGVALEAPTGIVVDNLGLKSATAKAWGKIQADHWRKQIAHRAPDLVIVMIGSNEAGFYAGKALKDYQRVMDDLLAPIRAGRPGGACLVIGPLDQVDGRDRALPQRRSIEPMVEAQRKAAAAAGCAFWDAYTWMGGARASLTWFKNGWITKDFAHPTDPGNRRIADALLAALLDGYAAYR